MSYLVLKEEEATCQNCVFFEVDPSGIGDGICRRFPPQVYTKMWFDLEDRGYLSCAENVFPEVFNRQWCGEWQPHPARQGDPE